MHCLGKKILLLLAVWLLTGGLAFADSFDLTDELQHTLFDRACTLETGLDEVRESAGDAIAPLSMRGGELAHHRAFTKLPLFNVLVLALMQPLPEVLKTFRI